MRSELQGMSWHENDIMDQNANGDAKGDKD